MKRPQVSRITIFFFNCFFFFHVKSRDPCSARLQIANETAVLHMTIYSQNVKFINIISSFKEMLIVFSVKVAFYFTHIYTYINHNFAEQNFSRQRRHGLCSAKCSLCFNLQRLQRILHRTDGRQTAK